MAEIYTLVKYQDSKLDNRVFDTLDGAKQVLLREYTELLKDINNAIKLFPNDKKLKRYKKYFSEEYAYLHAEDNTHAIWEIFTIQV